MSRHMLLLCLLVVMTMCLCACQAKPVTQQPETLPGELVSLSFSESRSYRERVEGYEFCAEEGIYTARFWLADEEEPYPVPVDQAWADTLTGIVRRYNLPAWDGFSGHADGLLDGTGFSITVRFSDGTAVAARGYGRFPEGYGEAVEAMEAHFLQLLPEDMRIW